MGGYGSGRPSKHPTTVEETRRIDIRFLKNKGWLVPGRVYRLSWTQGGEPSGNIQYRAEQDALVLMFRFREYGDDWESVEQHIELEQTSCNYGGFRDWFTCPRCFRRCAILCSAGKLFLCRKCYQLPYQSQRAGQLDRLIAKRDKLEGRLFGPNRPRMWNRTREKLHLEYQRVDYLAEKSWLNMATKLLGDELLDFLT